ncbi:hypothetical protein DPMN_155677 [Dreissena polymorpha]|uniref:Uncharacterized protein n=1 Tax=Dreissena polymorpha TaxID=45954 RepID=A0A9D4J6V1_DREPO|nr:hypothetical protein DPMN_155677 [Dreissena polymorpha]
MKTELEQLARSQCMQMTDLLKKHFKQSSVNSDIKSRFYANKDLDIPSDEDILGVQNIIRSYILKMILAEIDPWEQSSKPTRAP